MKVYVVDNKYHGATDDDDETQGANANGFDEKKCRTHKTKDEKIERDNRISFSPCFPGLKNPGKKKDYTAQ